MIKISKIIDNGGNKRKVYVNLNIGDKLICRTKILSKDDIGMSGKTFTYDSFIPNKIYTVYSTTMWDFCKISYIMDEGGTLHFASPDVFDLI